MGLANMAAHVVPARSESVYERGGGRHGQRASGKGAGHRLHRAVSDKQVKGGRYTGHLGTSQTARCDASPNWAATPG